MVEPGRRTVRPRIELRRLIGGIHYWLCITVDFDTLDDQAVTIRERDTMQQERVALANVAEYVAKRINDKRTRVPMKPVEMGGEAWPDSVHIATAGGLY